MYDVLDICKYIIAYSDKRDYDINNLKLQKLLYFIQAYFLLEKDNVCFNEEIEAWEFGPVVPEVYQAYKNYGANNIPQINEKNVDNIADNDKRLIEEVIDKFRYYTVYELTQITHKQHPWIYAYHFKTPPVITIESIKEYFAKRSEDHV